MNLKANQIHHGSCLDKLTQLSDLSVDLIFADPPFNIGYQYDLYDDQKTEDEYLDFCKSWISQCHRVLKSNGSFWLAIGDEYAAPQSVFWNALGLFLACLLEDL